MSLNASLKNRVRRLEQQMAPQEKFSLAKLIERARRTYDAMTPEERAADTLKGFDHDVDVLLSSVPDPQADWAWPPRDVAAWTVQIRRKGALHSVDGLLALEEPDAPEPRPNDYTEANVRALWAWQRQQSRRAQARDFLKEVEVARGLYTPRHWPLSQAVREIAAREIKR